MVGNRVIMPCVFYPWEIVHFSNWQWIIALEEAGTPRKKVTRSSYICMTHSEEPRVAEGGLHLPNETDYSCGNFVAWDTSH